MPDRVHVKFSYSAKDADVQEWIWKQPLGAVAEMANEYIAAVARGHVVHGHWKHDLVGDVPQKGGGERNEPAATRAVSSSDPEAVPAKPAASSAMAAPQVTARSEAEAAPAETPSPVIAEEPWVLVGEVREPVAPSEVADSAQPGEHVATPVPPAGQEQDSRWSATPAERDADPTTTSNPAPAETDGGGKMMRSDVQKIIDQAKAWQKK